MDAVDCALVDFADNTPRLVASVRTPWPAMLRERLLQAAGGAPLDATQFALLDTETGEFFADAIKRILVKERIAAGQLDAIGCHGQTVAHSPDSAPRTTLQLGDANVIAERTGVTTINDFRRRDMAAGGQGAPLAPAFHAAFLHNPLENRVVLNLGGIANVSVLPADPAQTTFGFDTGPANCLMDTWAREHIGKDFDADGNWAASAQPDSRLLADLLNEPYFERPPPKSTGTQHFSSAWLQTRLNSTQGLPAARVQATLMALTCQTVADAISRHATDTDRILVCGGGVHNTTLMQGLRRLSGLPVESTATYGIDPDWMEAMAFAWLAQRTLSGKPGNLPAVTGALGPRILGAIHPA